MRIWKKYLFVFKTATLQPLSSHLTNPPSKTNKTSCWALMQKKRQTHKKRSLMDSYTWTHQCWPTSKDLRTVTECSLRDLFGVMDDRDGWREIVREIRALCTTWWWLLIIPFGLILFPLLQLIAENPRYWEVFKLGHFSDNSRANKHHWVINVHESMSLSLHIYK